MANYPTITVLTGIALGIGLFGSLAASATPPSFAQLAVTLSSPVHYSLVADDFRVVGVYPIEKSASYIVAIPSEPLREPRITSQQLDPNVTNENGGVSQNLDIANPMNSVGTSNETLVDGSFIPEALTADELGSFYNPGSRHHRGCGCHSKCDSCGHKDSCGKSSDSCGKGDTCGKSDSCGKDTCNKEDESCTGDSCGTTDETADSCGDDSCGEETSCCSCDCCEEGYEEGLLASGFGGGGSVSGGTGFVTSTGGGGSSSGSSGSSGTTGTDSTGPTTTDTGPTSVTGPGPGVTTVGVPEPTTLIVLGAMSSVAAYLKRRRSKE